MRWMAFFLLATGWLLSGSGCTSDKARRESELAKLAGDLVGQYESADRRGAALVGVGRHRDGGKKRHGGTPMDVEGRG